MTYAENQLANFYQTESFPKKFVLAQKQPGYDENKPYLGQFKLASHEEELTKVRIIPTSAFFEPNGRESLSNKGFLKKPWALQKLYF